MDIDGAVGRRVQNIFGQYPAISGHHDQLRMKLTHQLQRRTVPHLEGLVNRQILCQCIFLYR